MKDLWLCGLAIDNHEKEVVSFWKLFLKPLLEGLQDQFGTEIDEQLGF